MDTPNPQDSAPSGGITGQESPHPTGPRQGTRLDTRAGEPRSRRKVAALAMVRVVTGLVALGVLYAALPIDTETNIGAVVIMVVATATFLAVTVHNLRTLHQSAYPVAYAARFLILIVALFVTGFAATYLAVYQADPGSFTEPLTKISAIYFTVTVLATVGFGDITASSEGARMLVTVQMVSGLTLLAVLARYVVHVASRRSATVNTPAPGDGAASGAGNSPADHPGE